MSFFGTIFLITAKDLRTELRARTGALTVVLFALVVVTLFHFAFDLAAVRFEVVGPGLIWVAIAFAALLGLQASFARERDALAGLLLSGADPAALFFGKALAALVVLLAAEAALLPVAAILFGADLRPALGPLAVVLALHSAGLAIVGTLFAALAQRLRRGFLLLPVLQFTLTVPLLMSAVRATGGVLGSSTLDGAGVWLRVAVAYDMVFAAAAALLFETLLED